jgi:hypothetical protein
MKLCDIFAAAVQSSDLLLSYYNALCAKPGKKPKQPWVDKFYENRVVYWPKGSSFWHASCRDKNLLVVGNDNATIPECLFYSESLEVLLRTALVMVMAAVDKILHEAISANFGTLLSNGDLDSLVNIPLSSSYQIAIKSREGRGGDGMSKARPGHMFKEKVLVELYKRTFLSSQQLERVSSACGMKSVFTEYSRSSGQTESPQRLKQRWNDLYERRNAIAHECDMVRKKKTKKIHFQTVNEKQLVADLAFAKSFGAFLAVELQTAT